MVIPCIYDNARPFKNGLAEVKIGDEETGKWGIVNTKGEQILPCKYDYIYDINNGIIQTALGDEYFYFNTNGESVDPEEAKKVMK